MHCIITFRISSINLTETASTPSTSVIPKWNPLQFGIYAFQYEIFAKYALVKSLCIYCVIIVCIYSQILTENICPSHFTLSFQNGPTIQFGILTKYALLQSLCTHCVIILDFILLYNQNSECKYSILNTIIPKWTDVPIWNVGFPMKNIDIERICVISLYTLCHHFIFHSIIRTVNASTPF